MPAVGTERQRLRPRTAESGAGHRDAETARRRVTARISVRRPSCRRVDRDQQQIGLSGEMPGRSLFDLLGGREMDVAVRRSIAAPSKRPAARPPATRLRCRSCKWWYAWPPYSRKAQCAKGLARGLRTSYFRRKSVARNRSSRAEEISGPTEVLMQLQAIVASALLLSVLPLSGRRSGSRPLYARKIRRRLCPHGSPDRRNVDLRGAFRPTGLHDLRPTNAQPSRTRSTACRTASRRPGEAVAELEAAGRPIPDDVLPTEEDFEKSLGYMERFFRRFMDIVKDFDKDGARRAAAEPQKT